MAEQRKATQRRPRIDGFINAIRRGDYDDKLSEIRGAVNDRYDQKKAEVAELVREVYGDEAKIVTNPFIKKAEERAEHFDGVGEVTIDPENDIDTEGAAAVMETPAGTQAVDLPAIESAGPRSAEPAFQGNEAALLSDPDFESRSPVIGAPE